jgi:hypothetical protein
MTALRLHVEGEHNDVTLSAFVDVLRGAQLILRELDSAISGNPKGKLEWKIVELGIASADAVIEAAPPQDDDRLPLLVGTSFIGGLQTIEEGEMMPPYFSETAVRRVGKISRKVGRGGMTGFEAELRNGQALDSPAPRRAELTSRAVGSIAHLLAPKYSAYGSVMGTLGQVNVQRGLSFNVYDALTKRAVKCKFEDEQFEAVKDALRRRVIVSGTIERNESGEPLRVNDPELVVLPEEEISTARIRGIDPGMTGGLTSAEYVRNLRAC